MNFKKAISLVNATVICLSLTRSISVIGAADTDSTDYLFHSTFETGEEGWKGRGDATVKSITSQAYNGSGSLYVSNRTATWNGAYYSLDMNKFIPGQTYSFSTGAMYLTGESTEDFALTLQYTDSSGTINYTGIASATAAKEKWTKLENTSFTIPSDASDMMLYVETSVNLIDFYIDEVIISGASGNISQKGPIPSTPTGKPQQGDINNDGIINSPDMCYMKSIIIGQTKDASMKKRADINGDDDVNAIDLKYFIDYFIGITDSLPEIEYHSGEYEKSYDFLAVNQLQSSTAIPDPFIFADGSKVESASDWGKRASEISCMYEYYMYGVWRDGSDEEVSYSISGNTMTIKVKRISTGKTTSFPVNINMPSKSNHEGGAPVIVGMHSGISESTATAAGYAVITIGGSIFSNPVASDDTSHKGAFYDLYPYGNTWQEQTGVLMAWSWGCSKVLDALEAGAANELKINPKNSIVTGVSRYGKAAMVCGAFEKRFKMCAPSCSGAGGVAIYRYSSQGKTYDFSSKGASSNYTYGQNEPLGSLQSTAERGWFNNRFLEFKDVNKLPMDQHMLCSLVADPDRYLFIVGSCVSEDWVNAPSMWLGYKSAKVIYDYLGLDDHIAVNIHKEGHALIEEDVKYMCQYFDYHEYGIKPGIDLSILQTSVFNLPKNNDLFFSSFSSKWTYK